MSQLLLINPKAKPSLRKRKRKGVKSMAKKRRSAAQKAATRKLVALNKHRKHKGVKTVAKKSVRRKRRKNPVTALVAVKRHRSRSIARHAPRRHRRRSNPIAAKLGMGGIVRSVTQAAIAAGGALSLDVIYGFLPIPDSMKVGPMRHVIKAAGAIGLGMLAGMVVKKETANALAAGALTVVAYNAAREVISQVAPQIALGEYVALDSPLSEYLTGDYPEGFGGISSGDDNYTMQGVGDGAGFDF